MPEKHTIDHAQFGQYDQIVYETIEEAGHRALASEGRFGWGMPADPATEQFIGETRGKTVFELGSGYGDVVALPSLRAGASRFYATDIVAGDLSSDSYLVKNAIDLGMAHRLMTTVLDPNWWNRDLLQEPTVREVVHADSESNVPKDQSIDRMIARHSLQFGSPETFLRFLDLASAALHTGGEVTGINFTPYTNYMYRYDNGLTMARIMALNEEYAQGKSEYPGSFIHSKRGPIRTSLARLMGRTELDRGEENTFLYFDSATLSGLIRQWTESRIQRNLPIDLTVVEDLYFTPPSIASVNKLTQDSHLQNRENHVFILRKI